MKKQCPRRLQVLSSSNKVATLEEEEAAKTQQECCISKKRQIWCVRTLQPNKRLGERGRDQDQAVRRVQGVGRMKRP
ncbi:hypothetical protein IGI04_042355 [Brassica rapa subsp. trilocularis]|uniref:Uncharacterized protein n=1 Tax=Brassica rapa subsp. trilocularis TaxID=1813537 RepID=A0ABQ7KMG5_BRACM|nr:hypothetical protein IGI04_042355 [Brassica rapa subsp. trilocularis]